MKRLIIVIYFQFEALTISEALSLLYLPPFLSGNFTLKILTGITYLVGGRNENTGKFLSASNGLFGFLPTFYPQKLSILTEVMGEENKMTGIFSSLTKIL